MEAKINNTINKHYKSNKIGFDGYVNLNEGNWQIKLLRAYSYDFET